MVNDNIPKFTSIHSSKIFKNIKKKKKNSNQVQVLSTNVELVQSIDKYVITNVSKLLKLL